jgi:hypothetical protein
MCYNHGHTVVDFVPNYGSPWCPLPNHLFPNVAAVTAGSFAVPTAPADGSWDVYQDFVGSVLMDLSAVAEAVWCECGSKSNSACGVFKIHPWFLYSGEGHTGPMTCLQFEEIHIVSIEVWTRLCG